MAGTSRFYIIGYGQALAYAMEFITERTIVKVELNRWKKGGGEITTSDVYYIIELIKETDLSELAVGSILSKYDTMGWTYKVEGR